MVKMPKATKAYHPGHTIRVARETHGLSQAALARLIGVTQGAIGQWERAEVMPAPKHYEALSEALDLPIHLLVTTAPEVEGLHPDAVELAVRASELDERTRTALLAFCDSLLSQRD